jgi:putative IMPACT (imprinted ancient) family translation regulator
LEFGGLIQAYKSAAKEAIDHSTVVRNYVFCHYHLFFDYLSMNNVMRILKDMEAEQYEQKFNIDCELKIKIKSALRTRFEEIPEVYPEIKIKYLYDE